MPAPTTSGRGPGNGSGCDSRTGKQPVTGSHNLQVIIEERSIKAGTASAVS